MPSSFTRSRLGGVVVKAISTEVIALMFVAVAAIFALIGVIDTIQRVIR